MADALDKLVLTRAFDGKTLNVAKALRDDVIALSYTYDAASTVTLTLNDPEWDYLTSGFFDRDRDDRLDAIDVELDGEWWRLTQISPADDVLTLVFEPRPIQRARFTFGHITVSRDKSTRAEFARRLVKASDSSVGFYSRELKDRQPIANAASSQTSNSKDPQSAKITHAPKGFSDNQKKFADACAAECGLDVRVIGAWMMREFGGAKQTTRGNFNFMSVGFTDSGDTSQSTSHPFSNPTAAGTYTGKFLKGETTPRAAEGVRAILGTAGRPIEIQVRAIIDSPWATSHYNHDYAGFTKLARSFSADGDGSIEVAQPYQFSVAKNEDYYTAISRLASEVNWRSFIHRGVWYFMDDAQLLQAKPQWTVECLTGKWIVGRPTFEWDHRGPYPQEMTVEARIPRTYVAPGDVVDVVEAGPGDGRWIVAEVAGTWFGPTVTVTLRQPQAQKKEPAHGFKTVETGALRDKILAEAKKTLTSKTGFTYYSKPGELTDDPTPPRGKRSDCSQWVRAVYLKAGADDPGTNTWEQARNGTKTSHPKPGDLLISPANHVELFVGDGKTIGHGSPPIDYWTVKGMKDTHSDAAFYTFDFLDR